MGRGPLRATANSLRQGCCIRSASGAGHRRCVRTGSVHLEKTQETAMSKRLITANVGQRSAHWRSACWQRRPGCPPARMAQPRLRPCTIRTPAATSQPLAAASRARPASSRQALGDQARPARNTRAAAARRGAARRGASRGCLTPPARALLERIESQFGAMQIISTCRPGARIAGTGQISGTPAATPSTSMPAAARARSCAG